MMVAWLLCALALGESDLKFDVASVKPAGPRVAGQRNKSGGPGTSEPGRVTFTGVPLAFLLTEAHDVWLDQVSGPAWVSDWSHAFTITATMPPSTTREQYRMMLQNLLADRFAVRVHIEKQTRPGYELVVGEGGPKIEEWKPGKASPAGIPKMDPAQARGLSFSWPMGGGAAPVRYHVRDTMDGFARALGSMINVSNGGGTGGPLARVVNGTGLAGTYDFGLEFTGVVHHAETADAAASDPGPTVFYAVEKQLGLKLRKLKEVPVDVVVVEAAQKVPTEN